MRTLTGLMLLAFALMLPVPAVLRAQSKAPPPNSNARAVTSPLDAMRRHTR